MPSHRDRSGRRARAGRVVLAWTSGLGRADPRDQEVHRHGKHLLRTAARYAEVSDTTQTVDEAPTAEEVSDTPSKCTRARSREVSDTTQTVDEAPTAEEVSDTPSKCTRARSREVSDTTQTVDEAPAAEEVSDTPSNRRHLPRITRAAARYAKEGEAFASPSLDLADVVWS